MPPRSHIPVEKPTEHSLLLNIARRAHLFLTPDGQPHVTVPLTGNTVPLYSPIFRDWLSQAFEERGFLPSSAQYGAVLRKLDADAHTAPHTFPVHIRAARNGHHTYRIDLDNSQNEAIEVNGKQWSTTYNENCRFRRPQASLPLPTPTPNNAPIEKFLMRLFSITEPNAQMLATWLVSALLPDLKPPILVITGEEAFEAAQKLRTIIDPVKCPINALPVTENQFGRLALINRVPTFSVGTQLTKNCIAHLNNLRKGITVIPREASKTRENVQTTIHRPIIIAAHALIQIHGSQVNIEINKTCSTNHDEILASLLVAVVAGIHEMTRIPEIEHFNAPDLVPAPTAAELQPPPPFT